jgi:oxygen-independent coproporphyrinogen-3 oxidase
LPSPAGDGRGRDLRCRHNLGYWLGHDYLGLGVGAVSTIENRRLRNASSLARYVGALEAGQLPAHEVEDLPPSVRDTERIMLGLRLDEPLPLAGLDEALDAVQLERLEGLGLAIRDAGTLALTPRGRFLGGGVTARLLS